MAHRRLRRRPAFAGRADDHAGYRQRPHCRTTHLEPLLAGGVLRPTIPDKLRSSRQRYVLTDAGIQLKAAANEQAMPSRGRNMDIETSWCDQAVFPNPSLTLVYFGGVGNALDAGATEVAIDIDVQAFDKPDTLKVTVSDNGDGFTDENFDRFKTPASTEGQIPQRDRSLGIPQLFQSRGYRQPRDNWRRAPFKNGFDGNAPLSLCRPAGGQNGRYSAGSPKSALNPMTI